MPGWICRRIATISPATYALHGNPRGRSSTAKKKKSISEIRATLWPLLT